MFFSTYDGFNFLHLIIGLHSLNWPHSLSNRPIQSVKAHTVPPSPVSPENHGILPLLPCSGMVRLTKKIHESRFALLDFSHCIYTINIFTDGPQVPACVPDDLGDYVPYTLLGAVTQAPKVVVLLLTVPFSSYIIVVDSIRIWESCRTHCFSFDCCNTFSPFF